MRHTTLLLAVTISTTTAAHAAGGHWQNDAITLELTEPPLADVDVAAALAAAADTWRTTDEGPAIDVVATLDTLGPDFDGRNSVTFVTEAWAHEATAAAVTLAWTEDGVIVEVDVIVNLDGRAWSDDGALDALDAENALTHELGHVLGLPDVDDEPDATMYFEVAAGETKKRDLHADDRAALTRLYEDVDLGGPEAAAGCANIGASSSTAAGALCFIVRRRRRSPPVVRA